MKTDQNRSQTTKSWSIFLVFMVASLIFSLVSEARGIEQAIRTAKDQVMMLAQVSSGIAIALGAIAFQVGWAQVGKNIVISGLIGVALTVGGPALISLIQSFF